MHTAIPAIAGVPIEFILFAAVLAGVAVFHHHSLRVALIGLAVITLYKIAFSSFHGDAGVAGLGAHLAKEWVLVINLLLLIIGFALLARHFEESRVPLAAAEPASRRLEGRLRDARRWSSCCRASSTTSPRR